MKRKILLCWNYERLSWVTQFEEILDAGEYAFINLFSKELEKARNTKELVLYWNDFNNVDHLIDAVEPEKVVFMGLDSPYAFLLNYACRKRGIKTYYLQHGIFHSFEAYLYEERSMRRILGSQKQAAGNSQNFDSPVVARNNKFFTHSFKIRRAGLYYRILKFLVLKKILYSTQRALKAVAGEIMQTDRYIVYTKHLSKIFQERDKVNDSKMIEIGNDEANKLIDSLLKADNHSFTEGDYFLFIDEAFTGSVEYLLPPIVTVQEHNDFLLKLSAYARSKEKRLRVKLHPYSYNVDHFIEDDNIDYVKQSDITELISNACGVFGFSSTLLIPAMFVKRACIFKLNNFSHIHQALTQTGYCKVLSFHDFITRDIEFNDELSEKQVQDFIKYFLYKLDDKCLERLKQVLHSN